MLHNNQTPIGNNIKKWRAVKGFTQKEFAQLLGISKSSISKIEKNKQQLTVPRLHQIADCLQINTLQLFVDPLNLIPEEKE